MPIKSSIHGLTILSLVATMPLAASAQDQTRNEPPPRHGSANGFCVSAPALPQLPAEARWERGERPGKAYAGSTMARRTDMAMALPSPAAPPPPPPAMAKMESESVVVTGSPIEAGEAKASSRDRSDDRIAPTPYPRPPRHQPQPQAGLLTAGEHDDLLNPELYARYVKASDLGQQVRDLPQVDTRSVLTVEVKDSAGRPVPFAQVRLTCSDGNSLQVATLADGSAAFFPGLDRLSSNVRISATRSGQSLGAERTVQVSRSGGGQQVTLLADQTAGAVRKLDLMLVVDTTGSMQDELRFLQVELKSVVGALARRHPELDVRVGFVFYRDEGDEYVTSTTAFDGRMERIQGALEQQYATGGGDYPEAMDQALIRAVGQSWRPDAVKSLLLVADAPPHDDKVARTWLAARVAREKRIQITPVAASGVADTAEYAMRAMAALTQSRYLFLTDDSGVGNPHAPPAIDCYLVTRLDTALRRVLDSQISGRRIEPEKNEVIRSVGQYDAGRCVLPRNFDQS